MVRSPHATSLILGREDHQDTIELEVRNPNAIGLFLRELRLPYEVIVQSIYRNGNSIVPHGNFQIREGDLLTLVGTEDGLEKSGRCDWNRDWGTISPYH
jgi:Trk K+ transport system NAD-binding subunit